MAIEDGGYAFPSNEQHPSYGDFPMHHGGMSLRDWFAGQALAGMLASADTDGAFLMAVEKAPSFAYRVADAMLAARRRA